MKDKENILKYADKILAYAESRLYIEQNDYDSNDYFGLQRDEFMNIVCYLIDNNLIVATDEYNHYITNNGRLVYIMAVLVSICNNNG